MNIVPDPVYDLQLQSVMNQLCNARSSEITLRIDVTRERRKRGKRRQYQVAIALWLAVSTAACY